MTSVADPPSQRSTSRAFQVERQGDLAFVWFDLPGEKVKALIQNEIDRFNQNLDRQEKIRRFALLPRDFTIEDDEITPSLKVKRKNIDKKYKDIIDTLYADENLVEGTA